MRFRTPVTTEPVGCPTVVHAAIIAQDAIESYMEEIQNQKQAVDVNQGVINKVLDPFRGNLTVTPKEIDTLINDVSEIIAGGINMALHPGIGPDDYAYYLH